jgi:putative selenium metabolism hydrolase
MRHFKLKHQDQTALTNLLREIIQIPSPSSQEGPLAERITAEMTELGLRDVHTDQIGNVVGWIGSGKGPLLMLSGHMDTTRVSNPASWNHAPLEAEVEGGTLYGLGACDMKGGLAAMLYGAKLLKPMEDQLGGSVVIACTVQQELCDGTASRVLVEEDGIHPDWVVLGEPTDMNVSRGQRGRVEMRLVTHGCAAHAACPDVGDNAIYTASRIVFGLELLAGQLGHDDFLGRGTLAVTNISCNTGGHNAVPDRCELILDRRLTVGENETKALAEVQRVIAREGVQAEVEIAEYAVESYTGYTCHGRLCYLPWVMAEDHPLVTTAVQAARAQTKRRPLVGCWDFSTEGVYTAGVAGIPTVGFGPGNPRRSHTADEHVRLTHVYTAAEVYARIAVELVGFK